MAKRTKHYHVSTHFAGCLADNMVTFHNRKDAEREATQWANEARELLASIPKNDRVRPDGSAMFVVGSARKGCYAVSVSGFLADYINITECDMPECLEEEEE